MSHTLSNIGLASSYQYAEKSRRQQEIDFRVDLRRRLRFMGLTSRNMMGRLGKLFTVKPVMTFLAMVCVYHLGKLSAPCNTDESVPLPPQIVFRDPVPAHLNRDIRMDKGVAVPQEANASERPKHKEYIVYSDPGAVSKDKSLPEHNIKIIPSPWANEAKQVPISQKIEAGSNDPNPPKSSPKRVYLAKDYYGTGSAAHHDALRRMGAESVSKHRFKSPFIVDPHIYSRSTIRKPPGNRKLKVISCYNCPDRFYASHKYNNDFKQCPYSECRLTTTSGMNPDADVMIFWQDPETKPPPKPKNQLWIYMSWETPPHRSYPKPDDLWLDKFNYTISYRLNADFILPYDQMYWRDQALLKPDSYYLYMAKRKTKMATWWVSHCKTRAHREQYVRELQKYIDVDVYGACGNFTCERELSGKCHDDLNETYRFYLSFENSFCIDYVTEKFFKMFRYRFNIIPVVRSAFNYDKYIPPNIVVDAEKFASPEKLANHLKYLASNHTLYAKMLKEKDKLGILNRKIDWCDFCETLHAGKLKNQVIHNVKEFTNEKGRCWDRVIED